MAAAKESGSSMSIPNMPSDMESPLNAQKSGPEQGPQAPTGLPKWEKKDPMGICPPGAGKD